MNNRKPHLGMGRIGLLIVLVVIGMSGLIAGVLGRDALLRLVGQRERNSHRDSATETDARQLWTCGMHPQVIREEPGLCPICEMELTPVQSGGSSAASAPGERGRSDGRRRP